MASTPKVFTVVGGGDKGGIVVRAGEGLKSPELPERLSTGAAVLGLQSSGTRLRYLRLSGEGPWTGWVTTQLKEKELLVPAPQEISRRPLLICFYSGGFTNAQGLQRLEPLTKDAQEAGCDVKVYDHFGDERFVDCKNLQDYTTRIIDDLGDLTGQPCYVFAHSHGCLAALAVARELGSSCRKLYVAARRPPDMPLLDEVWSVSSADELKKLSGNKLLRGLIAAWPNEVLEQFKDEDPLPPPIEDAMNVVKQQYAQPALGIGSAESSAVAEGPLAPGPWDVPILALAAADERPLGETAKKVSGWERYTSEGNFALAVVEKVGHMALMSDKSQSELVPIVLTDLLQVWWREQASAATS